MKQTSDIPPEAIILATIEITKFMVDDDVIVCSLAQDESGEDLDMITKLGMLEMAKDYMIHED